jgi:amino acid transporter
MEKIFAKVVAFVQDLKEYLSTSISVVKLKAADKTSKIAANLIAGVILFFFFLFFISFASIGFVYLLAIWTGEMFLGFFIVSIVYLFLGVLLWKTRERWLRIPILKVLIKQMFKEDTSDEKKG